MKHTHKIKPVLHTTTLIILTAMLFFSACRKKDPAPEPAPAGKSTVEIQLTSKVGSEALVLNNNWYRNENGDSFQVTKFNYYLSNIRLNGKDGSVYTETESYHLIQQNDAGSMKFTLADIPQGSYTSITLMIGVDSTRNVSGAQTGALAQENGMFWDWNSGYIMAKFEAVSPQSSMGRIIYHIGGFSGTNNPLQTVTIQFPNELRMNNNQGHLGISADLATWFKSPNHIDFSEMAMIHMPGADAKKIAENYADMLSVDVATFTQEGGK